LTLATYISILEKYKHLGSDIGEQAWNILGEFGQYQYLSTYNIYSNFKRKGLKVDYKNTYKRVKRLASLEFIEPVEQKEIKEEDTGRRAIYYRISEAGMFRLFYRNVDILGTYRNDLFHIWEIHGNSSFFETLLYPYFEKETFAALHRTEFLDYSTFDNPQDVKARIVFDLCRYLSDCCPDIYRYTNRNKKSKSAEELKWLSRFLTSPRDDLIMNILKRFQKYKDATGVDALAILAQDDKFMQLADELHKDFERGFNIAMRMGKRS
jgi:hypothetical protein